MFGIFSKKNKQKEELPKKSFLAKALGKTVSNIKSNV